MKRIVTATALVLCFSAVLASGFTRSAQAATFLIDFRGFYCGAQTMARGPDPYREEPLRSCEERVAPDPANGNMVLPDPFPPFVIAAFVPLALLPYPVAAGIWLCILLASLWATVFTTRRLTGYSYALIIAAYAVSTICFSIWIGQLAPLAIAAVCLAAYCMRLQRWWFAGMFAAPALIEPHLGIAAIVGAMLVRPMRVPVLTCGAVFVAFTLFAPLSLSIEYVTKVIGAHAASELVSRYQLSLSTVLFNLGVPAAASILLGSLFFSVALFLGVAIAAKYLRAHRDAAVAALIPPAFAVFGGPHIHAQQVLITIPACLLLLALVGRRNVVLTAALLLLVTPWTFAASEIPLSVAFALAVFVVVYELFASMALACAIGAATLGPLLTAHAFAPFRRYPDPVAPDHYPGAFAEVAWAQYVRSNMENTAACWWIRLPAWIGQGLFVLGAIIGPASPPVVPSTHEVKTRAEV